VVEYHGVIVNLMSESKGEGSVIVNEEHVCVLDLGQNAWRICDESDIVGIPRKTLCSYAQKSTIDIGDECSKAGPCSVSSEGIAGQPGALGEGEDKAIVLRALNDVAGHSDVISIRVDGYELGVGGIVGARHVISESQPN